MLNMTSAYYIDQLAEKLQLMLATGELQIAGWSRECSVHDAEDFMFVMNFELIAPQSLKIISYESPDEDFDFIRMIKLLATRMAGEANEIVAHELAMMNPKKETNKL